MAASSSPTVRRRQLATELKRLRLAAKMTIEQVAERLEWSPGKISKIENARGRCCRETSVTCFDAYGIGEGPEREALLTLARQSRERGWWQQYGEAVPDISRPTSAWRRRHRPSAPTKPNTYPACSRPRPTPPRCTGQR